MILRGVIMTNYTFLSANVFAAITEESVRHFVDAVAGGFHVLVEYHNGFTASIVKNAIVSGNLDLWEIAILHNGEICHNTSIMDDVVPYLSDEEVLDYCSKICDLDLARI